MRRQEKAAPSDATEEVFGGLLDPDEIRAGSGKTSKFDARDVELAGRRIDAAGVVEKIGQWRAQDRAGKQPGGRPPLLNDRTILVICLMLVIEGSPMWMTEMANVFRYRLTPEARTALGIDHLVDSGIDDVDAAAWYSRVGRSLHSIIDTWDGWKAARRLHSREERIAVMSLRDKNLTRLKLERCRWFTNAMLEMTLQSQPREVRRAWKGAVSADQTSVKAPSQLRVWQRDEKTGEEIPRYDKATGEEIYKPVLEIDAALYPVDKSAPIKDHTLATAPGAPGAKNNKAVFKWEQSYMANLFVQVAENPGTDPGHPQLFVAASLGTPNKDTAEHTVALVRSIKNRGHRISRLTVDRGYNGNLGEKEFHIPLREMNVPLVVDYKANQKGIQGGAHGTVQVEGAHYCPATPKDLLEATVQVDQKIIDWHTYHLRIAERVKYRVRPKEKPDANGKQPMMCPAYGPSATVECPIRAMHPKAAATPKDKKAADRKPAKAVVLKRNVPARPDEICTKTSVTFDKMDGVYYAQPLHYAGEEWRETYAHDRNSMESMNDYVKSGPERLISSSARRLRGLAAQSFIMTMLLTSANLRKISRYLRDKMRSKPKKTYPRRRDTEGLSTYVRWFAKPERVLWEELKPELRKRE